MPHPEDPVEGSLGAPPPTPGSNPTTCRVAGGDPQPCRLRPPRRGGAAGGGRASEGGNLGFPLRGLTRRTWMPLVTLVVGGWLGMTPALRAAEIVISGFEDSQEGWTIPDWAKTSTDYVAKDLTLSSDVAQEGNQSLKFWAVFPGDRWTGAYLERAIEVNDWTAFGHLSAAGRHNLVSGWFVQSCARAGQM